TTNVLRIKDVNGNPMSVTLSQAPVFDSAPYAAFTAGMAQTVTIQAHGVPAPTISVVGSAPSGYSFSPLSSGTPGVAKAQIVSNGAATAGTTTLNLQISNSASTIQVPFQLSLSTAVQITSPATLEMTYGQPVNFT